MFVSKHPNDKRDPLIGTDQGQLINSDVSTTADRISPIDKTSDL